MKKKRGASGKFKHEITQEKDDLEIVVSVNVEYYISPYDPGCMYMKNGDPGYPAEGGDLEELKVTDSVGDDCTDKLSDKQREEIEQACFDHASDPGDDY